MALDTHVSDLSVAFSAFIAAAKDDAKAGRIEDLLRSEKDRVTALTLDICGLHIDLSKQAFSAKALKAGLDLISDRKVADRRADMWSGAPINTSENRAVLHVALRDSDEENLKLRGAAIHDLVKSSREAMKAFVEGIRSHKILGATGKPFTHILHIGIGGSDLGPRLVWDALRPVKPVIDLKFAANVDGSELVLQLAELDPETTLVIGVSKTFGTMETLANFEVARAWLTSALGDKAGQHLAAVSAAPAKCGQYGVSPDRVFAFGDYVGGRYSLWSAVSLSCAIGFGWEVFSRLLDGARQMDQHFLTADPSKNAPILMALAQIYNRVGRNRPVRATIPYAHRLRKLASFLQQLEMESNGKSVRPDGSRVSVPTSPYVFGEEGTNSQHAFFQMLHQSADITPLDLIVLRKNPEGPTDMHQKLLANILAQAEGFMTGKPQSVVEAELRASGKSEDEIKILAPQKTFEGDRPSSLIMLETLSPEAFGALIALYEHKTFVEGVIMGINSFDQWGVELGKVLAVDILGELTGGKRLNHDASTEALIDYVMG